MAALVVEALALVLRRPALHTVSLWNLGLGVLGAVGAVLSGRQAMAVAKHSMEIHEVMELHERLGYGVLILGALLLAWRILTRDSTGQRSRWAAWLFLGLICAGMAFSAHLGGRMVYEFGVGGSYGRSSGIEVVGHKH
ncbi:MAG: DUF2231 domain-containing protein [Candidatus Omnitrophica bacterium]|nr:DUF2231 domain-containing protein [Candidatus Omnitrophota bacterium]